MEDNAVYVLLAGDDLLSASFFNVSRDKNKLIQIIRLTYEWTEGLGDIIETEEGLITQYTYYSQELERNRSFLISKEYLL